MKLNLLKSNLVLVLLVFTFALSGCFNSGGSVPYYTISDEFASYCWFEEGSWWYYQNDSTLVADTVLITEVDVSKRLNAENDDYNYQAVEMYTTSSVLNITKCELTAGDYEAEPDEMNSLMRLYFADGSYEHIFSPQYPIGEEVILGDEIGVYTNVALEVSKVINGKAYTNVWHTRRVVSVNTNAEYNYWIAENYGLVKFTVDNEGEKYSVSLLTSGLIQN